MPEIAEVQGRILHEQSEPVRFSYAHDGQSPFRRLLITLIERASGSRHLKRLYDDWVASGAGGNPFDVAIQLLQFRLDLNGTPISALPGEGGLLLVANHPFGIADGLALGWLATRLRDSVRILTHSLLCSVPEFMPYLLPVDFSGSAQARRRSATARRTAVDVLRTGGAVLIFPGGSVATSNRPFTRPAAELPWHSFVARLARSPGTHVVPIHAHGQNSLGFQLASHVSYPLRVAMLFHETRRLIGHDIRMTIGAPLSHAEIEAIPCNDIASVLRSRCLALGGADPADIFRWPAHIKW